MMTHKNNLLILIFIFFGIILGSNYSYSESRKDVIQFLEVTGMYSGIQKGLDLYIDEMKKQYPNVPDQFWLNVYQNEGKEYISSLKSFYHKIYSERFSPQEMTKINDFFQTEHGKKFQKLNKELMPKFMEVTMKEHSKLEESLEKRLKKIK